jgi:hypothetical protein
VRNTELLTAIRSERDALEGLVRRADLQALSSASEGSWAAKDHLSHLTHYARWAATELERGLDTESEAPPRSAAAAIADQDERNAALYEEARDLDPRDVLESWRLEGDRLERAVSRLSDAELAASRPRWWTGDGPLWDAIAAETFRHYREHRDAIAAALGE